MATIYLNTKRQVPPGMIWERYENTNPPHSKYWEVCYPANALQGFQTWGVCYGRIGATGQHDEWQGSQGKCHGLARAKIAEKTAKGYVLVEIAVGQGVIAHPEFDLFESAVPVTIPQTTAPLPKFKSPSSKPSGFIEGAAPKLLPKASEVEFDYKRVTTEQRTAIVALLKIGTEKGIISAMLNLTLKQVDAVQAHHTMGTYTEDPVAINKVPHAKAGKRKFYWTE